MAAPPGVPRHIAIIMDGNGRWAQAQGLERVAGHEAGAETVRQIVRECGKLGVEVLTLYSFSTENWSRPGEEVEALMGLLAKYLLEERDELMENSVRLRGIGQIERLPEDVQELLAFMEKHTAQNEGLLLQLALSYGSRAEITLAVQDLAREVAAGRLGADEITEAAIGSRLYTGGQPDPDLLIRTSGEMRLSNFLLWQIAYAEIWVTDVAWPDFRGPHLREALASYGRRQRRFGMTGAQVEGT
jgi:undecaprenyl diphosphate synthase